MGSSYDLSTISSKQYSFLVDKAYSWDNKLIDTNELSARIYFMSPKLWTPPKSPAASNGLLDKLSLELIHMTLENTDLGTLMQLRRTNSHLKAIIELWSPFCNIMNHAPTILKALIATGAANMYVASQVERVIFTDRCEFCGECGTFLQLLKLRRCCFRCLANDRRLLSVDFKFATSVMGVRAEDIDHIPHLQTIPRYNFWGMNGFTPSDLAIDYTTALQFSRRNARTPARPTILEKRLCRHRRLLLDLSAGNPGYQTAADTTDGSNTLPLSPGLDKLDLSAEIYPPEWTRFRFLAAIHVPILKTSTFNTRLDSTLSPHLLGGYCRGCRHYWNLLSPHPPTEQRYHTLPEMKDHLEHCFYARCWWKKLYNGLDEPDHQACEVLVLNTRPFPFVPRHAGVRRQPGFDVIPGPVLAAHKNMPGPKNISHKYGEQFLGPESESQATWATASRDRKESLRRCVDALLGEKTRKAEKGHNIDIQSWCSASLVKKPKPRMFGQLYCKNGLPWSRSQHPEHTMFIQRDGQQIAMWFEDDETKFFEPQFLDHFSQ